AEGASAAAAMDDVVEYTAAHGFQFRQAAEAGAATARKTLIVVAATIGACGLLLAFGIAFSLGRPIRAAMRISERVAAGDFTDEIKVNRRDELGRLLKSLAEMQASLKTKAAAEVAHRELQARTFDEQQVVRRKMLSDLA